MNRKIISMFLTIALIGLLPSCSNKSNEEITEDTPKKEIIVSKTFYDGYVIQQEEIPLILVKGQNLYLKYADKEPELIIEGIMEDVGVCEKYIHSNNSIIYTWFDYKTYEMNLDNRESRELKVDINKNGYAVYEVIEDTIIYELEPGIEYFNGNDTIKVTDKKIIDSGQVDKETILYLTEEQELYLWKNKVERLIDKEVEAIIYSDTQVLYEKTNGDLVNYDSIENKNYKISVDEKNQYYDNINIKNEIIVFNNKNGVSLFNKKDNKRIKLELDNENTGFSSVYFLGDYIYMQGNKNTDIYAVNLLDYKLTKIIENNNFNNITIKDNSGELYLIVDDYTAEDGVIVHNYKINDLKLENEDNMKYKTILVSGKIIEQDYKNNKIIVDGKEISGEIYYDDVYNNLMLYKNGEDICIYDLAQDKILNYGDLNGYDEFIFMNHREMVKRKNDLN